MTFNMAIDNDRCRYRRNKHCHLNWFGGCIIGNIFGAYYYTYTKLNCGGKGFAAVLHTGGYRAGNTGSGMGY